MPYDQVSLADLRVQLQARRDAILQWTPEEERRAINEALRFWNLLTGRWRRRASQATVIGGHLYTLPSTIIYGMRVTLGGSPLVCSSLPELDSFSPNWRSETIASGLGVPTSPAVWVPISLQQIAIWPATTTAVANALSVDGVSATPTLSEEADQVDLGQELHDHLLNFCLHLLTFKTGGPVWAATRSFYVAFLRAASEENGILKSSQKFRRASGLNRRGQIIPSKDAPNSLEQMIAGGQQ